MPKCSLKLLQEMGGRWGRAHEVLDFHTVRKNSQRALGVWPAHENGHIMSVGTRGNYVWALGAHR